MGELYQSVSYIKKMKDHYFSFVVFQVISSLKTTNSANNVIERINDKGIGIDTDIITISASDKWYYKKSVLIERPNTLGIYKRDEKSESPLWKQVDPENGYYLYHNGDFWIISNNTINSEDSNGWVFSNANLKPDSIPIDGWMYADTDGWISTVDETFQISVGFPHYPEVLIISSKKFAAHEQSTSMGKYLKVNGLINGRPYWRHQIIANRRFLYYADNGYWVVSGEIDVTCCNAFLASRVTGHVMIPEDTWRYAAVEGHINFPWDKTLRVREFLIDDV